MDFLEQFPYMIKYNKDKSNVDALSRRHNLFSKLGTQIIRFDHIYDLYEQDSEFSSIFANCQKKAQGDFYVSQVVCS